MAQQPSFQGNIAITSSLWAIKPDSREKPVQMLWQMIADEWFPGRSGYRYAFQRQPVPRHESFHQAVTFTIVGIVPDPVLPNVVLERPVMIVECNGPSAETAAGWPHTIERQFVDGSGEHGRIYAAVAVGKKVRFYRLDGRESESHLGVTQLHATIDLGTADGRAEAEIVLHDIKERAWDWAWS